MIQSITIFLVLHLFMKNQTYEDLKTIKKGIKNTYLEIQKLTSENKPSFFFEKKEFYFLLTKKEQFCLYEIKVRILSECKKIRFETV